MSFCAVQPWDVKRLYYDRHQKADRFDKMGVEWEEDLNSFLSKCDIVTINVPLTDSTRQAPKLLVFNSNLYTAYPTCERGVHGVLHRSLRSSQGMEQGLHLSSRLQTLQLICKCSLALLAQGKLQMILSQTPPHGLFPCPRILHS